MTEKSMQHVENISELDRYLFGNGTHYEIYKKLGAHPGKKGRRKGIWFGVWAPHARSVSAVGEFNAWDTKAHVMTRLGDIGIFETFVPEAKPGDLYKFAIETQEGQVIYKADPFANMAELRPGTASRIADFTNIHWQDKMWLRERSEKTPTEEPINIYEVHIGSWKRKEDETFYNYREFAREATKYMKHMGYTHVELMGICEHPYDGSWGYQVTGYFAPTSRYGTLEDFAWMVNYFHKNKIGVILDWVPAHFPKDAHGLAYFDGTATFEYPDPARGEHPDWGTLIFDLSKTEVQNFLIASALYWVEALHVDGLRVDAVASMLYLDYGRQGRRWTPNIYGGNENLDAVEFFKHLNTCMQTRNPGVLMIAEESTAWPRVTGRPEDGGLGFTFKWNMGWMHDFLEYMKLDPYFRKGSHYNMTFGMTYAYSENYVLVLSHDEVVHLKGSMLGKMPGLGKDKVDNLKAAYAFFVGHPGKKLLFMGQDYGEAREWSEERALDWERLEDPVHKGLHTFTGELFRIAKRNRALFEGDQHGEGFEWINADDRDRSIYSFIRHSKGQKRNLLFVINFTPVARDDYMVGVPKKKTYRLILNSDEKRFGGSGLARPEKYKAEKGACDGREFHIAYPLPPYGVAVFEY